MSSRSQGWAVTLLVTPALAPDPWMFPLPRKGDSEFTPKLPHPTGTVPNPTDVTQIFPEDESPHFPEGEMSSVLGQDVHSCSDLQLEFSDV